MQTGDDSRRAVRFDRGFQQAVADGCLTPLEAMGRGNRDALAARIAKRHGLDRGRAYAVADNRVGLLVALRDRDAPEPAAPMHVPKRRAGVAWLRGSLAAAMLAAAVLGFWGWQASRVTHTRSPKVVTVPLRPVSEAPVVARGTPDRSRALLAATDVQRDEMGRIVRVVGPDPKSVAIAFCEAAAPGERWELLGVTPSFPTDARSRLGVIHDLETKAFLTVALRQDGRTRRWTLGAAQAPVVPSEAPQAAVEAALMR